jgi:NAD(P)-dependent dehydrogenase (short-subunit alcohol dehydrogenase family)
MQDQNTRNFLIVGASGSIGVAIQEKLFIKDNNIWKISRSLETSLSERSLNLNDVLSDVKNTLSHLPKFNGVIFAQGANVNDSVMSFDKATHQSIYNANVLVILELIHLLITHNLFAEKSALCIVSSIWQDIARNNKLSYSVSKSALKGLVLSLVADISVHGIRVNSVLPGPIDNAMTRKNLSNTQIAKFESESPSGSLSTLASVVNAAVWLVSPESEGVTGNFLRVDSGASHVRLY